MSNDPYLEIANFLGLSDEQKDRILREENGATEKDIKQAEKELKAIRNQAGRTAFNGGPL